MRRFKLEGVRCSTELKVAGLEIRKDIRSRNSSFPCLKVQFLSKNPTQRREEVHGFNSIDYKWLECNGSARLKAMERIDSGNEKTQRQRRLYKIASNNADSTDKR